MFKVDFQKAFDSVRWDHLDDILGKFGFGDKWRGWIRGCLQSPKALVLINGSPTDEFLFHRGIQQRDPLSLFLFILVMETSGLKINVTKSSLYGVGVRCSDVQMMADMFGCLANNLPFTYLGVKVGANMDRINAWHEPIQSVNSIWTSIHKSISNLKSKGVDLMEFCKKVIRNGNNSSFWHEKWIGNECFKVTFNRRPRGGVEECQWNELSHMLSSIVLSPASDCWAWSLDGNGIFSVKSAREKIDKHFLINSTSSTGWSKLLLIKLNVLVWHMFLDKLPTRTNLSNRSMDIPYVLCPVCESEAESHNHLFFGCLLALDLFSLMGRWWNIHIPSLLDPVAWEAWFNELRLNSLQRLVLEASFFSL
nr:RNA-directed DNA polymerase, eukaryota [Tanacetum cinerariifolium]